MSHLLVTNDFPPKIGGIQSYLWELWRRLPPDRFSVLTTPWPGSEQFDAAQPFRVVRTRERVLLPTPGLARRIRALASETGAGLMVLDPALPLGLLGPELGLPYAVVVHGAEIALPGRLPGSRQALRRVLRGAALVVAGGRYAAAEATAAAACDLPLVLVPPGVDTSRFRPLGAGDRAAVRARHGIPAESRFVLAVSRLVPRKGIDALMAAATLLARDRPDLVVAVAGAGRDRTRLERLAAAGDADVRFLGMVADADLPALMAAADVFAIPCRRRWGGLEQEGFGIVFLEAAACGVPQVAGDSGGAAEAVVSGRTGFVVADPGDPAGTALALARLLDDLSLRRRQGEAGRRRAEEEFSYDVLAPVLDRALAGLE
ncbi:MAG: glycosyltransferase family 4 protein [Actinomycetota bacterium]|nr:glycosyltransferase family 4 protein [Actinomycetota bacterium]